MESGLRDGLERLANRLDDAGFEAFADDVLRLLNEYSD